MQLSNRDAEPSDPLPPFLSRANSRVFSLSNMLRGTTNFNNDVSYIGPPDGRAPYAAVSGQPAQDGVQDFPTPVSSTRIANIY